MALVREPCIAGVCEQKEKGQGKYCPFVCRLLLFLPSALQLGQAGETSRPWMAFLNCVLKVGNPAVEEACAVERLGRSQLPVVPSCPPNWPPFRRYRQARNGIPAVGAGTEGRENKPPASAGVDLDQ